MHMHVYKEEDKCIAQFNKRTKHANMLTCTFFIRKTSLRTNKSNLKNILQTTHVHTNNRRVNTMF